MANVSGRPRLPARTISQTAAGMRSSVGTIPHHSSMRLVLLIMGYYCVLSLSLTAAREIEYKIVSSVQTTRRRHVQELTNQDGPKLSNEEDFSTSQISIGDFKVSLTTNGVVTLDHEGIANELENSIMDEAIERIGENDAVIEYVQLIGPDLDVSGLAGNYDEEGAVSAKTAAQGDVLSFPGGAAVFEGTYVPSKTDFEIWIKDAVEQRLVPNLHTQSSAFKSIQSASYLSDRAITGVQRDIDQSSDDDDLPLPIILGAGVGGFVVLALLAMFVTRRRRPSDTAKDHLDAHNAMEVTTGDLALNSTATNSPGGWTADSGSPDSADRSRSGRAIFPRAVTEEARSVAAGSESSFTVGSEAGDSQGLKSASYQHVDAQPMVAQESFEHERRVTLRKDMLTSTWIGQTSPGQGRPGQMESVLEPSHFIASQQAREVPQEPKKSNQKKQKKSSGWFGGSDANSSLRFESSSGDDAYLQRTGKSGGGELV